MSKQNQTKGFTIIEVVLVLAIAALIFLLVFLALPALQRSRRDTQRRDDVSRVLAQVQTWQANNNGQVPQDATQLGTFWTSYMQAGGDAFNDPQTGTVYAKSFVTGALTTAPSTIGTITYDWKAKCNAGGTTSAGTNNQVAVIVALEGSGAYCADNS